MIATLPLLTLLAALTPTLPAPLIPGWPDAETVSTFPYGGAVYPPACTEEIEEAGRFCIKIGLQPLRNPNERTT